MVSVVQNFRHFMRELQFVSKHASSAASSFESRPLDGFQRLYLETLASNLQTSNPNESRILRVYNDNNTYVCFKALFPPLGLSKTPEQLFQLMVSLAKATRPFSEVELLLRQNPRLIPICNMCTLMYSFMYVYTLHVNFVSKWRVTLDSVAPYMNDTLPLVAVVYMFHFNCANSVYLFYKRLRKRPELAPQGEEFVRAATFQSLVARRQWSTITEEILLFLENNDDHYNFNSRFIDTHVQYYGIALQEIQSGKKLTHWCWYMFPTPPYVVNGREQGSHTNQHYALRDKPNGLSGNRAALAYLLYPTTRGVNLRAHLLELVTAVQQQLDAGVTPLALLGAADVHKVKSCLQLFQRVTGNGIDAEVHDLCTHVLRKL